MHVGHLGIPVHDYERSLSFYATYFGFDPATAQTYPDGTVIVRNADGFDLALHPTDSEFSVPPFVHFGFRMPSPDDVRSLHGEIKDKVKIVEYDDEPGLISFKCLDPDGWPVEVYWEREAAFDAHPVDAIAALLPDPAQAERVLEELRLAGVDLAEIELLSGPEGVAVVDERGSRHGLKAHLVRLLQKWTYYEQILLLYTAGMRHGGTVIVVPCAEERAKPLAEMLLRHGARSIHYFGFERVEDLSGA